MQSPANACTWGPCHGVSPTIQECQIRPLELCPVYAQQAHQHAHSSTLLHFKSHLLRALRKSWESLCNADPLTLARYVSCRYKKELENKYCFRQAELGVGDCAGLRVSDRLLCLYLAHPTTEYFSFVQERGEWKGGRIFTGYVENLQLRLFCFPVCVTCVRYIIVDPLHHGAR